MHSFLIISPSYPLWTAAAPQADPGSLAEYSCQIEISLEPHPVLGSAQASARLAGDKHQLKKHGLEMSPELLRATCREPACPGESGCSWKAKGKQAKEEMYEDVLGATPVCPIWGCALCGELQLEAGGSTSSSGFVLAQCIKPARSAWEISVCSSTSQLALSCCFLGEKELLKPKQCTQPATAMRIKCNSQGNIS